MALPTTRSQPKTEHAEKEITFSSYFPSYLNGELCKVGSTGKTGVTPPLRKIERHCNVTGANEIRLQTISVIDVLSFIDNF
jgi:hypothetical protein